MKAQKKKMGRPLLKPKDRLAALITLRLKAADKVLLEKEAKAKSLTVSGYLIYCWKGK